MISSRFDFCVAGSSLSACCVAAQAAAKGRRVLLLAPGFSLGSDVSGTLRAVLQGAPGSTELAKLLHQAAGGAAADVALIRLGRMKKLLLQFLEAAGVTVLFGARMIRAEDPGQGSLRISYARKGGMDRITCDRLFWDGSRVQGKGRVYSTLEYDALDLPSGQYPVTVAGERLEISVVTDGAHHGYVSFPVCDGEVNSYRTWQQAREQAAQRAVNLAEALVRQMPAFAQARICRQATQLYLENTAPDVRQGPCISSERSLPPCLMGAALDALWEAAAQTVKALDQPCGALDKPLEAAPQAEESADVLVLGAGTLGVPAAAAAGSRGVRVLITEAEAMPGGISTLGGIKSYFAGNIVGYVDVVDQRYEQLRAKIHPAPISGWNMQLRIWALEALLRDAGVRMLPQARVIEVEKAGNRITSALLDTPYGLVRVSASLWIDATGDGDAAALAGIPFTIGDEQSGNIQTSNQSEWTLKNGFGGINVDLTVHDPTDALEIDRCAKLAHHQGADYDFNDFAACRESRNFQGAYTYTLEDLFLGKVAGDTIVKSLTPYDQHSQQSSLIARLGFLPYHQEKYSAYLPYRCCYAPQVENLLFGGKCVSAQRDAYPFLRMMPDIINQGYALGRAARYALTQRCGVQDVDMDWLRSELITARVLDPEDLARPSVSIEEIVALLDAENYRGVLLAFCYGQNLVPRLQSKLVQARGKARLYTALALACLGHGQGADLLEETLRQTWQTPQTQVIDAHGRPFGGVIGEEPGDYWLANALIIALSRLREDRFVPLFAEILGGTHPGETLPHVRLHWRRAIQYDRILSLCEAAFAHPHEDMAQPLAALLDRDGLGGWDLPRTQGDDYGNYPSALLELTVARAAYRCHPSCCGDVLARYAQDIRKRLANAAKQEMERVK